ncbi:SRPBCC family protein [Nocardiopsis halotolerans]|uniref:SRPBCC family protein n=1 Tax=Nocardiopsis halotolerans TaxID=124252 RepID=UPI00034D5DBA|nr:SRPBCC family protein [Nocardiopsis halotolerans]
MSTTPTGRLFAAGEGNELVLTRTFRAPADDVWRSVTEPERTARWFGPWEGEAGPGRTVRLQMAHEEGAPWCDLRVDACDPPHRLAVSMDDEAGVWPMELTLAESGGTTTLTLTHSLRAGAPLGEIGPGWEYYLDMLVASREGRDLPDFDDYHPAQKAYFEGLVPE